MATFRASVNGADPGNEIAQAVAAAGALWAQHLVGQATLDILVTVKTLPGGVIAEANSGVAVLLPDGHYQQGTVIELLSGRDPNGSAPDILIDVDPAKLAGRDALTVFTHEIGHALVFNGWLGAGALQSLYDALIDAPLVGAPFFLGTAAEAINGGPVALAPESPAHYAQAGLMNPYYAGPQSITALDLAFAADIGAPVRERFGTLGNDTMPGTPGDDIAYGGYGNDTMQGNQGADTLYGWAGDDRLYGGKGDDLLLGGDGNDTISGDMGNDTMTGGAGQDRFIIGENAGTDHITDFQFDITGQGRGDLLQFSSTPTVWADFANYRTVYELPGTTLFLDGVITILPDMMMVA